MYVGFCVNLLACLLGLLACLLACEILVGGVLVCCFLV